MVISMKRLVFCAAILGASATLASAQKKPAPPPATVPLVGDALPVNGVPTWVKRDWLYDVPSTNDAAGKVVIHWFCGPKVKTCVDDLARLVTLKENARVYIVAYIDGSKAAAKKLDPIRESEGVGRGTLAFGRGPTTLMKQMAIKGPMSVIVDVDGKVALVTTSGEPAALDMRDQKATALAGAIKDYAAKPSDAPKGLKPNDKFTLSLSVTLSPWMKPSTKTPTEFKLTSPPDFKCDAKELKGDQVKVDGQTLTATVTCSAPRGAYEARGELRFSYQDPSGAAGLGTESAGWKFDVKP